MIHNPFQTLCGLSLNLLNVLQVQWCFVFGVVCAKVRLLLCNVAWIFGLDVVHTLLTSLVYRTSVPSKKLEILAL